MKLNFKTSALSAKGFTLLEILIAMFIVAIVMSMLYTSYTTTFRNIDETAYQAEIYEMARIVMTRIVGDLESAYIYIAPENRSADTPDTLSAFFKGEESTHLSRSADTLSFSSKAHLDFKEDSGNTGRANITYYFKEHNNNEALILYRSDTPDFEMTVQEEEKGMVLCEDLYSVDFKFFDEDGETYETWDSTSDTFKNRLPVMVSIKLEFINRADKESPFKFMTAVALHLATGKQS